MKTLLQLVQNAEAELGLPQSSAVLSTGTTDATGTQMGALANRVLDELRRMNRWTSLQAEYDLVVRTPITTTGDMVAFSPVITNIGTTTGVEANYWQVSGPGIPQAARVLSVDSPTQVTMTMENANTTNLTGQTILFMKDTYPMPADFDWFNNDTMWDRTNRWRLLGPDSPQIDQWHRSGIVATGPRRHFRKIGPFANTFRIWPPPSEIVAPLQLVFEYLSTSSVQVHGAPSTFAEWFANDDDVSLLDDQAITMGIKWMFWEAKGFGSYVTLQSRWVDYVDRLIARDGAAPKLKLNRRLSPLLLSPANIQDGYFPGPTGPNTA